MYQSSNIPSHVIDDSNFKSHADDTEAERLGMSKGWKERQTPYGEGVGATFEPSWLIPESEWKERIEEREKTNRTIRALKEYKNVPSLNQNGTNYCWAHGPTCCMQIVQLQSGEELKPLSAVSVAAPIKNFQNVGGWGDQALNYIRANGINEVKDWPINKIDRRYFTAENKEKAKKNLCQEWLDLKPKNFNELMSCLLRGIPVAVAFMWWSHLVTAVDAVIDNGEVCPVIWNSWSDDWGDKGLSVIKGNKKFADEQIAPLVRMSRGPDV